MGQQSFYHLTVFKDEYTVCKLAKDEPLPNWIPTDTSGLTCVTRTDEELSIVCKTDHVRKGEGQQEDGWKVLKVSGPLDFSEVGILANLSTILANARISIFAISTFDTDYLLVQKASLETAADALHQAGHTVINEDQG